MTAGVVACAAYRAGLKTGDVALDRVSDVLLHEGEFVWIGLYEPDGALLAKIQHEFGLHELAVEDARNAHQRPKVDEYGESLFVVLRTAQRVDGALRFGETHVFVGSRYVVSVRHGASLPYTDVRARCEASPQLLEKGPAFVLYAIMDFVVDQYFPIAGECEERLEALEEAIFAEGGRRDTTEAIYDLKRELVALKRAVTPLIDVCNRLVRFGSALIPEATRPYFRDVYDHVIRINEQVDTQRELLTTALEANLSLVGIRQNEVMKRLAAWAAILAVPTAVAGIYGMNFEAMPELHWAYGYPVVMGGIGTLCGVLYWRFRRAGWL
jgi:magnesium transporter